MTQGPDLPEDPRRWRALYAIVLCALAAEIAAFAAVSLAYR